MDEAGITKSIQGRGPQTPVSFGTKAASATGEHPLDEGLPLHVRHDPD